MNGILVIDTLLVNDPLVVKHSWLENPPENEGVWLGKSSTWCRFQQAIFIAGKPFQKKIYTEHHKFLLPINYLNYWVGAFKVLHVLIQEGRKDLANGQLATEKLDLQSGFPFENPDDSLRRPCSRIIN